LDDCPLNGELVDAVIVSEVLEHVPVPLASGVELLAVACGGA
jgi:hypothetical protein